MSTINSNSPLVTRRKFLHNLVLAISGSTLLSQTHAIQKDSMSAPKPSTSTKQASSSGYRETEHIRNYYKSAGL